jgi:hypothetical protein
MGYIWVIYGLYMGYIIPWYNHATTMIRRRNSKIQNLQVILSEP